MSSSTQQLLRQPSPFLAHASAHEEILLATLALEFGYALIGGLLHAGERVFAELVEVHRFISCWLRHRDQSWRRLNSVAQNPRSQRSQSVVLAGTFAAQLRQVRDLTAAELAMAVRLPTIRASPAIKRRHRITLGGAIGTVRPRAHRSALAIAAMHLRAYIGMSSQSWKTPATLLHAASKSASAAACFAVSAAKSDRRTSSRFSCCCFHSSRSLERSCRTRTASVAASRYT